MLSLQVNAVTEPEIEELVVTANKRQSIALQTAASLTVFSGESLSQKKIDDLNDLSINTPSLSITDDERITIRGIGQETIAIGSDPGVATFSDGVYLRGTAFYQSNNFFDMERIEVLRGPQGTLYGRNTAGGAINLIRKKPSNTLAGEINLELGNYDYRATQGVINVPVSEGAAFRVALSKIARHGLQENEVGPDVDELDNKTYDATLAFTVADNWQMDIRGYGFSRDGRPESGYIPGEFDTTTRIQPGAITVNSTYGLTTGNPAVKNISKTRHDFDNVQDESFNGIVITNATVIADDINLKYIVSDHNYELDKSSDADRSDNKLSSVVFDARSAYKSNSHELQFISDFDRSFNFILGLYYYNSKEESYIGFRNIADDLYSTSVDLLDPDTYVRIAFSDTDVGSGRTPFVSDPINSPQGYFPGYIAAGFGFSNFEGRADKTYYSSDALLESTSKAVYGQLDYAATERTIFSVGLRYTEDKKIGKDKAYLAYPLAEGTAGEFDLSPPNEVYAVLESLDQTIAGGGIPGTDQRGNSIAYLTALENEQSESKSWNNVSGLLRIEYEMAETSRFYASISTGYRAGGFSFGTLVGEINDFDEENVVSYELGYKEILMDKRGSLEVASFYYDYKDLQVLQAYIDESGAQGNEIRNAASATIYGLELQGSWFLTNNIYLQCSYAYTQSQFDEFETIDTASLSTEQLDLSGNTINRTPENKFAFSAAYNMLLSGGASLTFISAYSWVDEMYTDVFNSDNGRLDSWGRVDANIVWASNDRNLTISAFIKNINNERHATDASRGTATDGYQRSETVIDPRLYGLRLNFKF